MASSAEEDAYVPLEPNAEIPLLAALRLIRPKDRVLDLGCFRGHDAVYLATGGGVVTGIDMSRSAIEYAKSLALANGVKVDFQRGVLPGSLRRFTSQSFDVVMDRLTMSNLRSSELESHAAGVARVLVDRGLWFLHMGYDLNNTISARTVRLARRLRLRALEEFERLILVQKNGDSDKPYLGRDVFAYMHPLRPQFHPTAISSVLVRRNRRRASARRKRA